MVDIHCHILPGFDDGSDSMETSLQMAEMAISEGVTHIVGTPHANSEYDFFSEAAKERRDELQSRLGERISILTGCDFHLSFENVKALRRDPQRFTLNEGDYLLVEFANFAIPASLDQTLHELQLMGLHPIITHPERNPLIRSQWERLWGWLRQGCYVQVTSQSITGGFGRKAQKAAELLLDANAVHFVASDAHNLDTRPLKLKAGFDAVAESHGENAAHALFEANPRAAIESRELVYVPDAVDWKKTQGESEMDSNAPRKRFWFF